MNLDRFDWLVFGVIAALLAALGVVVARGDQVGVYVRSDGYGPRGMASGAQPVRVRFSEAVDRDALETQFQIEPATEGTITWASDRTLLFTPQVPFAAGETYTVRIAAGAGLLDDFAWSFTARLPRVAYLAPANSRTRNVFVADLSTGAMRQITAATYGVENFAVSADGSQIAYTQNNNDGTADVWIINAAGGTPRQVTACVAAMCTAPTWHPDGSQLAYQRIDFGAGGASRVWLVNLTTLETGLLFTDAQILGEAPQWSPDGRRLAVFDVSVPGIRVHDFTMRTDTVIESMQGEVGRFSPDGTRLVYPVMDRGAQGLQFYTRLEVADFEAVTRTRLSGNESVEDNAAAWSPDGTRLLVARRYLDERYTAGNQLYVLDLARDETVPLVVDDAYTHAGAHWDASGRLVVFQRFALDAADAEPEIWTYDTATGTLTLVAEGAFLPRWLF